MLGRGVSSQKLETEPALERNVATLSVHLNGVQASLSGEKAANVAEVKPIRSVISLPCPELRKKQPP